VAAYVWMFVTGFRPQARLIAGLLLLNVTVRN